MISIGPDISINPLFNTTGKVAVSADLPGVITITADQPGITISPSTITVGGTVDSYCLGTYQHGLERRDSTLSRTDNFAIAIEFKITALPFWSGGASYFCWNHYWGSDAITGGWALSCTLNTKKLSFYSYATGTTTVNFDHVLPLDTWIKCIIIVQGTNVRLITSSGADETKTRGAALAPIWDGAGYEQYGTTRLNSTLHGIRMKNFQFLNAVPTASGITNYLAGGKLGTLLVDLPCQEESGLIAYDQSGNAKNFQAAAPYSGSSFSPPIYSGMKHDVTGLTGTTQEVTLSLGPGQNGKTFTLTATRQRAGFPAATAAETDTCTITVPATNPNIQNSPMWSAVLEEIIRLIEKIVPNTQSNKSFRYGEMDDDTIARSPQVFRMFELNLSPEKAPKFRGNRAFVFGTNKVEIKVLYSKTRSNKKAGISNEATMAEDARLIMNALHEPVQLADGSRCRLIWRDSYQTFKEGDYSILFLGLDLEYYRVSVLS